MEVSKLRAHVGKGRKTICVQVLVPHLEHVVLDGADDDEDKETSKAEFTHGPLGVPRYLGWS